MPKTKETLDLENALSQQSKQLRKYGCEEVTIGFVHDGHGDEIVDYMNMDANAVFQCYEIKVTLADLKTDNKKSFYGDYNYLVVNDSLYAKNPVWENYIPPYCGILVGTSLTVKRKAKKKNIPDETREMLKDSLLRSIYYKMENYKDASDLTKYRQLQKQLEAKQEEYLQLERANEQTIWEAHDYEHYYRINHQDDSFTIALQAKKERNESSLREKGQYTWIKQENGEYCCPNCHKNAPLDNKKEPLLSHYCPFCGTDLRKIKK